MRRYVLQQQMSIKGKVWSPIPYSCNLLLKNPCQFGANTSG
jgi:hypothetical protein